MPGNQIVSPKCLALQLSVTTYAGPGNQTVSLKYSALRLSVTIYAG